MIVIKSNNQVQWGDQPSHSSYLYMRIPAPQPNFILGKVFVVHQYYRFVENISVLVQAIEEEIDFDLFNFMVSNILTEDQNGLELNKMHTAFYMGALNIIGNKQKFNTTAADWSIIEITEDDPLYNEHVKQIILQ